MAGRTRTDWERLLRTGLDQRVEVAYGRSRHYPIQVRRDDARGVLVVRMHRMFADAPEDVAQAVERWLVVGKRARRACELLDRWIEERLTQLPKPAPRNTRMVASGGCHDLARIAAPLLDAEFALDFHADHAPPRLTWGRRGRSRTRRSLRLGSFDPELDLVRIHPVLDQPAVPSWFVRYVLFHELLHAAVPPFRSGNRWIHHGPEFRRREALYSDYQRALQWEEENLPRLIRSARRGTRLALPPVRSTGLRGLIQGVLFAE